MKNVNFNRDGIKLSKDTGLYALKCIKMVVNTPDGDSRSHLLSWNQYETAFVDERWECESRRGHKTTMFGDAYTTNVVTHSDKTSTVRTFDFPTTVEMARRYHDEYVKDNNLMRPSELNPNYTDFAKAFSSFDTLRKHLIVNNGEVLLSKKQNTTHVRIANKLYRFESSDGMTLFTRTTNDNESKLFYDGEWV